MFDDEGYDGPPQSYRPKVYYAGQGPAQRIQARLGPSCPEYKLVHPLASDAKEETVPTRCVTSSFYSGSQRHHGPDGPPGTDINGDVRRA
jgi:hypothetical protein